MSSSNEQVQADLERDKAARESEIRVIEKSLRNATIKIEQESIRRSLVLIIYAHFEGHCRFALTAYAAAINSRGVRCSEAEPRLVASTLDRCFKELSNPSSTPRELRSSETLDEEVSFLHRRGQFVSELDGLFERKINIDDSVIDTQSNLKPQILKQLLFKLGLDYSFVGPIANDINRLLGVRNAIAHGDLLKKPDDDDVDDYKNLAYKTMASIQNAIMAGLTQKSYLKVS